MLWRIEQLFTIMLGLFLFGCASDPTTLPPIVPQPEEESCASECAPGLSCEEGFCGDVRQLTTGLWHSCALLTSGQVLCWETLVDGEGGNPVVVPGIENAVEITSGQRQTCALQQSGHVSCWDQFRDSPTSPQPARVGLEDATQVVVGSDHACAQLGDTTVTCWGNNAMNQVGQWARYDDFPEPKGVSGLIGVQELSAAYHSTCARLSTGEVACWGFNAVGALGDGTLIDRGKPVLVKGLSQVVDIGAGPESFCALKIDGEVVCWGGRKFDHDKAKRREVREDILVPVDLPESAVSLSDGYQSCATLKSGAVRCWRIHWGQLHPHQLPAALEATPLRDFDLSLLRSCALKASGEVLCWNTNPKKIEDQLVPVEVQGLPPTIELRSGGSQTCAHTASGELWCWGRRAGAPADEESAFLPTRRSDLESYEAVSLGYWHTCASTKTEKIDCWGDPAESG